jgi:hypothetical protein
VNGEELTMKGNRTLTVAALLALLGLGTATRAHADSDAAGTTAASFLTLGTGAAALGRGGATLGLGGDVTIASWNAASLGWIKDTEFALSHGTILEEHTQDYLVAGGRFGAHPLRWAVSGLYESEGTFDSRDASNNSTGSFDVSRLAAGATLAWPIHDVVSLGLGGKWVNESLGDNRGSGMTFDLGLQARWQSFGFGLAAQNVFGQMQYGSQQYDFPTVYGVGVGFDHAATGLRLAVDVNFPNAYYTDVRTGIEYR